MNILVFFKYLCDKKKGNTIITTFKYSLRISPESLDEWSTLNVLGAGFLCAGRCGSSCYSNGAGCTSRHCTAVTTVMGEPPKRKFLFYFSSLLLLTMVTTLYEYPDLVLQFFNYLPLQLV